MRFATNAMHRWKRVRYDKNLQLFRIPKMGGLLRRTSSLATGSKNRRLIVRTVGRSQSARLQRSSRDVGRPIFFNLRYYERKRLKLYVVLLHTVLVVFAHSSAS